MSQVRVSRGVAKAWFWASAKVRRRPSVGRRGPWTALLVVLGVAAPLASRAQPAPSLGDDVVALADAMTLPNKVAHSRLKLRAKLGDILALRGWHLVNADLDPACADVACAGAAARQAGARFLMRMTGAPNQDDGYDFALELFGADAVTRRRTAAYCNYCDVDRMGEVAGRFALVLLGSDSARALRARPEVQPSVLARPIARPALTEKASWPRPAAWAPWVLVGAGAAAAGYGAWALAKDGATVSCQPSAVATSCARYSSQTLGVAAVTGGAALVVSGAIWAFLLQRSSRAVQGTRAPGREDP